MKKSRILSLILLFIPLLIAIGFSTWVIIYEFVFSPSYVKNPVSSLFPFTVSNVYNGVEQFPQPLNADDVANYNISYEYYDEELGTYSDGGPIDVGVYDVRVTLFDKETGDKYGACLVKYEITQLLLKTKEISITYDEVVANATETGVDFDTYENFWDLLTSKVSFTDSSNNDISENLKPQFMVKNLHCGDDLYLNCVNDEDIVHGGTYAFDIELTTDHLKRNYALYDWNNYYFNKKNTYAGSGTGIVKYKTTKIGDNFLTIEEALSSSGDIILCGNTNTFITSFTKIPIYKDFPRFTLKENRKLWVTHNGVAESFETVANISSSNADKGLVYSVLYIPNGITLISNGDIYITSIFAVNTHIVNNRGVIFNNGTIELYGHLYSYGYVLGSGTVNAYSGSIITELLRFYNINNGNGTGLSGGITTLMNSKKIFPFNSYSFHNVGCNVNIYYGSQLDVWYDLDISFTMSGYLVMIGPGGLFELTDGYISKSVEDTTGSFYADRSNLMTYMTNNQNVTQREVIRIYATFFDNQVKLQKYGQGIATGTDYAMPIGFMSVYLCDDENGNVGNGTLSANSYKFLPGSKLIIEENTSLTIEGGLNCIVYDETFDDTFTADNNTFLNEISYLKKHSEWFAQTNEPIGSQFVVNGTLISKGNIGGFIQTTKDTGFISLASYSATLPKMTKMHYGGILDQSCTTEEETVSAVGFINQTETKSTFNKPTYLSFGPENNSYWIEATTAKEYTLNFYDENANPDVDQPLAVKKMYQKEEEGITNYSYEVSGNEYRPRKQYHNFEDWYILNGTNKVYLNDITEDNKSLITINYNATDKTLNSINLFAHWSEIQYSFEYFIGYKAKGSQTIELLDLSDPNLIISNEPSSFTYDNIKNGNIDITTTIQYSINGEQKTFNGWYLSASLDDQITNNQFTLAMFEDAYSSDSNQITLYCFFSDDENYTIKYEDGNRYIDDSEANQLSTSENLILPNLTEFDDDPEVPLYFEGWYIEPSFATNKLSSSMKLENVIEMIEEYNKTASDSNKISLENNTIILYAKCPTKKSISFYTGTELNNTLGVSEGVVLSDTYWYKEDSNITFPIQTPVEQGHKFKNWSTADGEFTYTTNSEITVAKLITNNISELYAKYSLEQYVITITMNDKVSAHGVTANGTSVVSGQEYDYGSKININPTWGSGNEEDSITTTPSENLKDNTYLLGDISITINGKSCIPSGTLLTLADGTSKKVEDLLDTDMLLVFNHETGKFESAPIIFVDRDEWKYYDIVNLEFSNGTKTRLIYEHGYFNLTLNKYVYITEANYQDYIGHEFAFYDGEKVNSVTLTNSYITNEYVGCYSPVTAYHLNYFVDGMLSMPGGIEGLFNIFEYNDDMTYDIEKMNEDIEKYGLYTYEDFKDYLPYEVYLAFPGPYLKVSVEKGYITFEEIIGYIEKYLGRHGLDK